MTLLDCNQAEDRIHEILDRREVLAADEQLAAHCSWCSECRELVEQYSQLTECFQAAGLATSQRWMAGAAQVSANPTHPISRFVSPHGQVTVAAVLLVALGLGLLIADRGLPPAESPASGWLAQASFQGAGRLARPAARNSADSPPPAAVLAESEAIAVQAQQWLATIEEIPSTLGDLQPYYEYTASLTGVTTLTTPVSLTVDMLRRRLSPQPKTELPSRSEHQEWLLQSLRIA